MHWKLIYPKLMDRLGGEPMVSENRENGVVKLVETSDRLSLSLIITIHTIANVALLSVSSKSDAASMLCCSISRRFFFIFSRCMSAAWSVKCGKTICGYLHLKFERLSNYQSVMHNWLKRIRAEHQTRMSNKRPSKHRWLLYKIPAAMMHLYRMFEWPLWAKWWHLEVFFEQKYCI